ncbi:aspartate carbamoyltransferase catalytic subunit [Candidatus Desulforudis audaxviator]|uniref:Aspartate carbamoyltransferase catalytic subunit n=1 Tax=Desulforudis audaxviator (strain MP104C) TaxID=477974 RepID=PYRB_DESAP|nr:aspartate carbamoyltransferase catalytic subunit [Candidatus Desulforudis audaxviator]B1I4N1.1 RecName: Full=Aspartate carbamoyltransferase catalytic subunit; AltName: Full=Aspartate transcarbamylase; Short=ATCase [Candidatus Desulforudis audaxviator MP104C]ACA59816.1 aspartate carbamoyltransferase [Candidatus Desulforudis audaxviator MP104C]AZK59819.1 Aspartate carbamoyltransferase [Candidatus Desulforudis audaxviator]
MPVRHLLGLADMPAAEINEFLENALPMKQIISRDIKKVPTLRGKTVVTLFYEPSTRTRMSFELAAKYLSADTVNVSASASSATKGESLADTARTIAALGADLVVLRHPCAGAPHLLARMIDVPVVNAGDGMHEHPTQALLDLFTLREKRPDLEGLKLVIIGDILHSRVARSNIWALTRFGVDVHLVAPPTLLPAGIAAFGVTVHDRPEDALPDAGAVMVLRLQRERQQEGLIPDVREYARLYGLNSERLALTRPDAIVMHPGPMNRGIEIAHTVADGTRAVITDQVTNGVAVRMAVLYLLMLGRVD